MRIRNLEDIKLGEYFVVHNLFKEEETKYEILTKCISSYVLNNNIVVDFQDVQILYGNPNSWGFGFQLHQTDIDVDDSYYVIIKVDPENNPEYFL